MLIYKIDDKKLHHGANKIEKNNEGKYDNVKEGDEFSSISPRATFDRSRLGSHVALFTLRGAQTRS